ncbi:MAG: hypothetical protein LBK42_07645 [Propionibacteriaceae bacterium]|jgi:hypothetical protein|nr:hypothetical protein [Propionibacteriaceae bacterium]
MGDRVQVGAALLNYGDRITLIRQQLATAVGEAEAASRLFDGGDPVYKGRAWGELSMFFSSYVAHIQKLDYFQGAAAAFLGRVFEEFGFTDDQLARVLTEWLDGGGG